MFGTKKDRGRAGQMRWEVKLFKKKKMGSLIFSSLFSLHFFLSKCDGTFTTLSWSEISMTFDLWGREVEKKQGHFSVSKPMC